MQDHLTQAGGGKVRIGLASILMHTTHLSRSKRWFLARSHLWHFPLRPNNRSRKQSSNLVSHCHHCCVSSTLRLPMEDSGQAMVLQESKAAILVLMLHGEILLKDISGK